MSTTAMIEHLLNMGYQPAEIVRMGYAKSTVYTVYKRWLKKRIGENAVYIAYDANYDVLSKFTEQLRLLGYNPVIGGTTRDTLDIINLCKLVVVIASKTPGYRRTLLLEEITEAIKHNKQIIALLEEGTVLPLKLPEEAIIISYNPKNPTTIINNITKILKTKKETPLIQILTAIIISLLIALGIAVIIEIIQQLLKRK